MAPFGGQAITITEMGEVKMLPTSCIRIQLLQVVVVAVFIANLDIETHVQVYMGELAVLFVYPLGSYFSPLYFRILFFI